MTNINLLMENKPLISGCRIDLSTSHPDTCILKLLKPDFTLEAKGTNWLSYHPYQDLFGRSMLECPILPSTVFDDCCYKSVIGLTMYNEGEEELFRSMRGIVGDFGSCLLTDRTLVVVIVDGMTQLNKDNSFVEKLEQRYKIYNKQQAEDFLRDHQNDRFARKQAFREWKAEVKLGNTEALIDSSVGSYLDCAILFKGCLALSCNDLLPVAPGGPLPSVDVFFVVKAENRKKLHSHLWLLLGFGRALKPKYVFVCCYIDDRRRNRAHSQQSPAANQLHGHT